MAACTVLDIVGEDHIPDLNMDISLAQILDPRHRPRMAQYTDRPPFAQCNVANRRMVRYVTAVRFYETHSIRDGAGLVEIRRPGSFRGPPEYERPSIGELERIMGFNTGDTDAPQLQALHEWARDVLRWGVLGNCIDANVLTYIMGFLPPSPVF